jgi:hypothetical protein
MAKNDPLHGSFEAQSVAPNRIFRYVVHVPKNSFIAQTTGRNPVGLRTFGFRLSGEFFGVGRVAGRRAREGQCSSEDCPNVQFA